MLKVRELLTRLLNGDDGKKAKLLFAVGAAVIVLLLLSEFLPQRQTVKEDDSNAFAAAYTDALEERLTDLLSRVDGAGKVCVMITLDDSFENEYAAEKTVDGDSSKSTYPSFKNGSGTEDGLLVKVRRPKVRGAAIVAQGADDPRVKAALTDAAAAVLGVSSARVSVEKMTEEKER